MEDICKTFLTVVGKMEAINLSKFQIAKSFHVEVICRILSVLTQDGPSKITNLAMSCHLNHNSCKKYVNLLIALEWIEVVYEKNSTIINITSNGRMVLRKLEKINSKSFLI